MPYRWVTSVGHGSLGQSLGSNVSDGCSDNGSYSFTGSAGEAIVSKTAAYLITDPRYWDQSRRELDKNHWVPIFAGAREGPRDWIDWLSVCITYFPVLNVAL